jgi:hypothetical protein
LTLFANFNPAIAIDSTLFPIPKKGLSSQCFTIPCADYDIALEFPHSLFDVPYDSVGYHFGSRSTLTNPLACSNVTSEEFSRGVVGRSFLFPTVGLKLPLHLARISVHNRNTILNGGRTLWLGTNALNVVGVVAARSHDDAHRQN